MVALRFAILSLLAGVMARVTIPAPYNSSHIEQFIPKVRGDWSVNGVDVRGELTFVNLAQDAPPKAAGSSPPKVAGLGNVLSALDPTSNHSVGLAKRQPGIVFQCDCAPMQPLGAHCAALVSQLTFDGHTYLIQPYQERCTSYRTCGTCALNLGRFVMPLTSGNWAYALVQIRDTCSHEGTLVGSMIHVPTCQSVSQTYVAEELPDYHFPGCDNDGDVNMCQA